MEYLLIDGYNIINSWKDIFKLDEEPLEDCRDRLINLLSNYQGYKKVNVVVVFDAHLVKGSQLKQEKFDNIKIVFTKESQTADNYIERFVYLFGTTHTIRVATSDYLEQTLVLGKGGIRMSPRELRAEIISTEKVTKSDMKTDIKIKNSIISNIKPELYEKLDNIRKGKV